MYWVIAILLLVGIGYLLDREIYLYEGVHLGPRVQAWLYDRWSRKYDEDKRESQKKDDEFLAQPLLEALKEIPEPFLLDFATGTGRLSYALTSRPEFTGRIIALDLSQGMLEQAAMKLSRTERRGDERSPSSRHLHLAQVQVSAAGSVEFLRHLALPLPFPDEAFDVVCALEVLELFPSMDEPIAEFSRILRPGGLLLTSRGTEEAGRKSRVKSAAEYTSMLERHGFEQIQITKWWKWFDRITTLKGGTSLPVARHELQSVLKCSGCGQIQWERKQNSLRCGHCGRELSVTKEGIVLG
jgi:ubiquinone/menaquinone biosynthesis C-methylase UbiE